MPSHADIAETTLTTLRILRRPEIRTITGFCDEQIDKMEARNQFPRRIHTGARSVGWVEHEVRQWLIDRMAERDDAVKAEEQRVARMPPGMRYRYRRKREGAEPPDARARPALPPA
jgi:prophage regulatory protein